MKHFVKVIIGLSILIGFSACGPSQAELLKEKQKKEKIRLEKLKKEKEIEQRKIEEAKKYLSLKNDNDSIWDNIDYVNKNIDKSIYETKEQYNERIIQLNKKVFGRKFIFDYAPKYKIYDADAKKLYLEVIYSRAHMRNFGLNSQNKITLSSKVTGSRYIEGVLMNSTVNLRSNFVYSNTEGFNILKNIRKKPSKNNYRYSAVIIKDSCSPSEAKEIQDNWKIRFVSNIEYRKKQKMGTFHTYFDIVNTEMIIIYNDKTKEIYKVLY